MSRRVLVVDDDRSMVATLRDIFELKGWETIAAHDGSEAVARVAELRPDVVLMDIRMPGVDGVAALKEIRARHADVDVVLMSAYSATDVVADAMAAGAVTVLKKPIDPARVLGLLESAADGSAILIVEDDPDFLTTLADVIHRAGRPVFRARKLSEALERLEAKVPGVVLLDLLLPGARPEDAVQAIRRANPTVSFVLYSGNREVLDRTCEAVPPEWVRACLHKPFDMEALLDILG